MSEIIKEIMKYLPAKKISDAVFEGANIVLYTKEKEFFLDNKHVSRMKKDNRITYHRIEKMSKVVNNDFIKKLANSDNMWDRISEIKEENYDGYVYDLTIEDTHTFLISNGLIAHNTTSK